MKDYRINRYEDICHSSKIGWWCIDFTTREVYVDNYLCSALSLPNETMSWDEFFGHIVKEEKEVLKLEFENFPRTNSFHRNLSFLRCGIVFPTEINLNAIRTNEDGNQQASGSIRIEPTKDSDKYYQLKRESDYLHDILEKLISLSPLYMFIKDTSQDFRYVYSSPLVYKWNNKKKGEMIGKTDFDIFKDKKLAQSYRDKDIKVLETAQHLQYAERIVDAYQKEHIIEITKQLIQSTDSHPYILGIGWDMSQHEKIKTKLAENNLRISTACRAGLIYPWTWNIPKKHTEFMIEKEKGKIGEIKVFFDEFANDTIHPSDKHIYFEEL
ncbi:MAG: hypothetical protein RSA44_06260, partial [Bacteroides sp.]